MSNSIIIVLIANVLVFFMSVALVVAGGVDSSLFIWNLVGFVITLWYKSVD